MTDTSAIRDGHFAKKQLFSKDRLIAWSHAQRFHTGIELAQELAGARLLDYGCGDGTFLKLLCDSSGPPAQAVGCELDLAVVQDCRKRLGDGERLSFIQIAELGVTPYTNFDAVICMEVLEHVVDLDTVLSQLNRVLRPGGRLIVSVPIETGLPVLVKQAARRVAGWRGIGDYPGVAPYSASELVRSVLARETQHIERTLHRDAQGAASHCHRGFNWMALRKRLGTLFTVERTLFSPVRWLPQLGSQAWIIASRPR